jgi:hypothetical protein
MWTHLPCEEVGASKLCSATQQLCQQARDSSRTLLYGERVWPQALCGCGACTYSQQAAPLQGQSCRAAAEAPSAPAAGMHRCRWGCGGRHVASRCHLQKVGVGSTWLLAGKRTPRYWGWRLHATGTAMRRACVALPSTLHVVSGRAASTVLTIIFMEA